MKQNKDREELEKWLNYEMPMSRDGIGYLLQDEDVNRLFSWIQSYTQKKVEEALGKVDFKQVSNPLDPDYK